MYAEKIFDVKFLSRRGLYMLKPVMRTFDAAVYLALGGRATLKSVPPGREDYALLDYHSVVDAAYDAAKVLKSISYNDVGVEGRYYWHGPSEREERIVVEVDLGRRLRKLEWSFEDVFESYLLGLEDARAHVDGGLWKYGNAYLVSMPVEDRAPEGVVVRLVSPLDGLSRFEVVFSGGKMRARAVGPPVNSFCFLSLLRTYDLRLLFRVSFRDPGRVWVARVYRKYLRRFVPVVEDYLEALSPSCDAAAFGRWRMVKVRVYAFDPVYDEEFYFSSVMEKKRLYVGGRGDV